MRDPRHALALILLTVATTAVPAADPPTTADAIPDRAVARLGVVRPRWNYATAHAFPSPGVLVTADDALTVCHWDLATGRIIRQQQFPCADTAWPRLSANGKFLAARDWGGASIRLINLETGEQMRSLTLPDIDSLWEFDISADGRFVAGIAHNKKALSAHLWVSATGKAVPLHTGKGYVQPPHFSPDGGRVVAFVDDVPQCWNAAGGTLIWSGEAVKNVDPTAFCFTPDGKFVLARASASVGSPLWWDSETGKLVSPTVKVGPNQPPADSSGSALSSISFGPLPRLPLFSANGRTMTTVLDGQKLEARDGKTGKLRKEIANVYGVLGLSPDGRIGAGWIAGGTPQCWDLDSGQPIWPEIPDRAHAGTVNRVVFSPNGRLLISVAADDEARLWDVPSRAVRAKIPAAAASLAAFTPDGLAAILATPSEWMVLDTATTQVKRQQSWPNDSKETSHGVVEIAISPDSKSMVTLIDMEGKELKVEKWDLSSGKLLSQQSLNSGRAFAAGQWVAPVRRAEAHLQ
ncbi:MAG TPA: WD40 repeat domain-containing protein, partial [Gemmataceae bacterium]|nr:WD40 repeat domain-containing protein [Gemmataceae bacterium]